MSVSSEDRISSKLTLGSVWLTGTVKPFGASPAVLRARVELDDHVVEAGLGAQQRGGVLVDRRVLAPDLHRHDRAPVDEVDLGDVADVDARHLDRLALARRHRLRGGELGLVVDEVRAHDRDPVGQVEALVGEDVAAHEQRHQHEAR